MLLCLNPASTGQQTLQKRLTSLKDCATIRAQKDPIIHHEDPTYMSLQEHRLNQEITANHIRLIDAEGEMKGVVTRSEALRIAEEEELDLVEIQPNSEPPVCRVMDYGKFRYEQQKKQAQMKKKQKIVETKEIQFRPVISQHDYETKIKHAREFLDEGNKVRLVIRNKGQRSSSELASGLLSRLVADLSTVAAFDAQDAKRGGDGNLFVIAAPLPKTPAQKVKP